MSIEILGLIVNATGWLVAGYLVKRFTDSVVSQLKDLQKQAGNCVAKPDCISAVNHIHQRLEEDMAQRMSLVGRISRLEGAAGK